MFVPGNDAYDVVLPSKPNPSALAHSTASALVCYCTPANPCNPCNACNCPSSCPAICPCRGDFVSVGEGADLSAEGDPLYRLWSTLCQTA
jgi:hypothetical protein